MIKKIYTEDTYIVCHDGENCHSYGEIKIINDPETGQPIGQTVGSGQPFLEEFTSKAEAKARALELGWIFPEGI